MARPSSTRWLQVFATLFGMAGSLAGAPTARSGEALPAARCEQVVIKGLLLEVADAVLAESKIDWKDPAGQAHRHVLEVEGVDKALAAREIFDDEAPVKANGLAFDGKSLKFTVSRGDRRADYTGKLDGDTIRGTVNTSSNGQASEFTWKAERRKRGLWQSRFFRSITAKR